MARVTTEQFIAEVSAALEMLARELDHRKAGIAGQGTVEELQTISRELTEMQRQVRRPRFLQNRARHLESFYIISDTWDLQAELSKRIMHVCGLYRQVP